MIKYNVCAMVFLFFTIDLYADVVNVYPDDISNFFVFANTSSDSAAVAEQMQEYEEKYKDDLFIYSEIVLMKRRVLPDSISSRDALRFLSELDAQWHKISESQDLKSYEYATWANIKTQKIPYLSLRKVIKESKLSTKYYKMAVKLDKKNALSWMSFGISMLFTPRITGGGVKKSLKYLEKAAQQLTTNDLEKYYVNLWLSQAYFKNGNAEKYTQAFEIAQGIFGETPALKKAKEANEKGEVMSW